MSVPWQTFVDEHLMGDHGRGHALIQAAAIFGLDGNVLAKSPRFPQLKRGEFSAIMNEFNAPGSIEQTGLSIGGTKYTVTEPFGSGPAIEGEKEAGGVAIRKTIQAVIFGIYDFPATLDDCHSLVASLGDYLGRQGY